MLNSKVLGLFTLVLCIFCSCSPPRSVTKEQLMAYILDEDNGLIQSKTVGDYRIELIYRPTDLIVSQELQGETMDTIRVQELRRKYANYLYFLLKVSKGGREVLNLENDQQEYSKLLLTMAFNMPEYVSIVQGRDTTALKDFMLDRTYGMSNSTNLLLVFECKDQTLKEDIQIILSEFGLGIGSIKFQFNSAQIKKAPRLWF